MSKPLTRKHYENWLRVHCNTPGLIPAWEYAKLLRHHLRALAVIEVCEKGLLAYDDIEAAIRQYWKGDNVNDEE